MNEHQKKVVDPRYGSVASVEFNVSQNIQALEDKIDFTQFKIINCVVRYEHSTQTHKDLGVWIQNQKAIRTDNNKVTEDFTPIFGDQATAALLPLEMGSPNFYAMQVQTILSQNFGMLG